MLGRAKKIIIDKANTTVVDCAGARSDIDARVAQIRAQIETKTSDYAREQLQERVATIAGVCVVIRVGGGNDIQVKEKNDRVETELHTNRSHTEKVTRTGGTKRLLPTVH